MDNDILEKPIDTFENTYPLAQPYSTEIFSEYMFYDFKSKTIINEMFAECIIGFFGGNPVFIDISIDSLSKAQLDSITALNDKYSYTIKGNYKFYHNGYTNNIHVDSLAAYYSFRFISVKDGHSRLW